MCSRESLMVCPVLNAAASIGGEVKGSSAIADESLLVPQDGNIPKWAAMPSARAAGSTSMKGSCEKTNVGLERKKGWVEMSKCSGWVPAGDELAEVEKQRKLECKGKQLREGLLTRAWARSRACKLQRHSWGMNQNNWFFATNSIRAVRICACV